MQNDEDDCPQLVDATVSTADTVSTLVPLKKVPVTIITGYLGSGKTTLLQHVLTAPHGKRIAVILNEFGDSMDIEKASLIQSNESSSTEKPSSVVEEWIELKNGCMCCSVKDAGVKALENLLTKRQKFDHILIETTGLANPANIISIFWVDEELGSSIELDGVIAVIDAKYAERRFEGKEGMEFEAQIAAADFLLLNKVDVIKENEVEKLKSKLADINALSTIETCIMGKIDVGKILDLHAYAFEPEEIQKRIEGFHAEQFSHSTHLTTICLQFVASRKISIVKLEAWLEHLLWEKHLINTPKPTNDTNKIDVVRLKGIILSDNNELVTIQGVCESYDKHLLPVTPEWLEKGSKLVFIGKNLNHSELLKSFEQFVF